MKKIWGWVLLIILVAGGIGGYFWMNNQQKDEIDSNIIRTSEITRGTLEITVSASGNVAANQKAELHFETIGIVDQIKVEVGDYVKDGQELARLKTDDLERSVRQSEIALEQAQIDLKDIQDPPREGDIQLARTSLSQASQALEVARIGKESAQSEAQEMMRKAQETRDKALLAYNQANDAGHPWTENQRLAYVEAEGQLGITQVNAELKIQQAQDQWLSAYNRYLQAKDNLEQLEKGADEDKVQQTELRVEQSQLNLEEVEAALERAILKAPFTGIIAEVNIQEGLEAPTTQAAMRIIDDSAFYVEIMVDETDISKVETGMTVIITLDAYPNVELEGIVENIAPAAKDTAGVVSYPLKIRLEPTDEVQVRDGMTASVIIQTQKLDDVVLIPNWAIRTEQATGETYVYCYCNKDEGIPLERVIIVTGERNESYTQVLGGLEEGAIVALVAEERNLLEFSGPPSR
ncbi:MAG: efflux RND transporter periplasmic adaptor subunit [Anaerolineae bacterium]|nr:efflux RND transporter periplasmic adaptor subunit [Anaerolineae bacterium]